MYTCIIYIYVYVYVHTVIIEIKRLAISVCRSDMFLCQIVKRKNMSRYFNTASFRPGLWWGVHPDKFEELAWGWPWITIPILGRKMEQVGSLGEKTTSHTMVSLSSLKTFAGTWTNLHDGSTVFLRTSWPCKYLVDPLRFAVPHITAVPWTRHGICMYMPDLYGLFSSQHQ